MTLAHLQQAADDVLALHAYVESKDVLATIASYKQEYTAPSTFTGNKAAEEPF